MEPVGLQTAQTEPWAENHLADATVAVLTGAVSGVVTVGACGL